MASSHFCLASYNEASQPPGSSTALHFVHLLSSSLQAFWDVAALKLYVLLLPKPGPIAQIWVGSPLLSCCDIACLAAQPCQDRLLFSPCYVLLFGGLFIFIYFFHLVSDSSCHPLASLVSSATFPLCFPLPQGSDVIRFGHGWLLRTAALKSLSLMISFAAQHTVGRALSLPVFLFYFCLCER